MSEKYVNCPHCGRRLIGRLSNGVWHFVFGKAISEHSNFVPVELFINGSLQIRCFRRDCGKMVTLNYFPNTDTIDQSKDDNG
jgi:hypothetical protein